MAETTTTTKKTTTKKKTAKTGDQAASKTTASKASASKTPASKSPALKSKGKYIFTVGRRKSATARVKFYQSGSGDVLVNGRAAADYFTTLEQQQAVTAPLVQFGLEKKADLEIKVSGGGLKGQAEAVRLAVARALVKIDQDNKPTLRQQGFLTVDSRVKERKKPGLKRARRAGQWRKR